MAPPCDSSHVRFFCPATARLNKQGRDCGTEGRWPQRDRVREPAPLRVRVEIEKSRGRADSVRIWPRVEWDRLPTGERPPATLPIGNAPPQDFDNALTTAQKQSLP